jgi:hypothetical protein
MLREFVNRPTLVFASILAVSACGSEPDPSANTDATGTTTDPTTDGTTDASEAEAEVGVDTETGTEMGTDTDSDACSTETSAELAACVDKDRYLADLQWIAQPRSPGSDHWQAVQDLCFDRFTEYGFEVERQVYPTGVNVVGRKLGTQSPEQQILVAAHYDHIPGCNGADDNATGTAATLEAARVLAQREFPRTLIVACWDQEELGLIGARAYADAAAAAGDQVLFNYNFEMIGYYDDAPDAQSVPAGIDLLFPNQYAELQGWGFTGDWVALIVDENGLEHANGMAAHAAALGLKTLVLDVPDDLKKSPLLSDLQRSDHAAFWNVDYPAMMITDTSEFRYANYHCGAGEDAYELLDHDFARDIVAAAVGGAAESLGL